MRDGTRRGAGCRIQDRAGQLGELGLPLEELVRRGARGILHRVIEAEIQTTLEEFAAMSRQVIPQIVVRRHEKLNP
jgi:hypothetical protein